MGPIPRAIPGALFAATIAFASPLVAQSFDAGSDGSLGDVVITNNTVVDLPEDGILHFKSLIVNGGTTLSFNRNARNTAVHILSQGDVVVNGTISVNGNDPTDNTGGLGGPGGFDGGKPGFGAEVPPGDGYGPGGGQAGPLSSCDDVNTPRGGSYGTLGFGATNGIYGSSLLIPLVGGSGGGGTQGSTAGGGGGGGALLVASNTRIAVNGSVTAQGKNGGSCNSGGSGGAIRLLAFKVEGTGTVNTSGGQRGGLGRVRVDTVIRSNLSLNISGVSSIGGNLLVFPPTVPTLSLTEAAGNTIPPGSGPVIFTLPFGSSTNRTVKIQASGFARNVPIRVTLTPDSGAKQIFDAEVDNTTLNPALVTVPVTVPVNTLVTVHCWTR
jgi:hypothetical protein